jgi:hypothetical protein
MAFATNDKIGRDGDSIDGKNELHDKEKSTANLLDNDNQDFSRASNLEGEDKKLLAGTDAKVKEKRSSLEVVKCLAKGGPNLFSYDSASLQRHEARVRAKPVS